MAKHPDDRSCGVSHWAVVRQSGDELVRGCRFDGGMSWFVVQEEKTWAAGGRGFSGSGSGAGGGNRRDKKVCAQLLLLGSTYQFFGLQNKSQTFFSLQAVVLVQSHTDDFQHFSHPGTFITNQTGTAFSCVTPNSSPSSLKCTMTKLFLHVVTVAR